MGNSKMICPKCGDTMNHHANKVIYSDRQDERAFADPALGGVIEETHNCPGCGVIASRIAS